MTPRIWAQRYEDINAFERYLSRNGTVIRKFFLHISKDEQRRRLLERLDEPSKNWKFQPGDLDERDRWDEYQRAYEQMLSTTSTRHAPWFVVPADHKWFTRVAIAELIGGYARRVLTWRFRSRRRNSWSRSQKRAGASLGREGDLVGARG